MNAIAKTEVEKKKAGFLKPAQGESAPQLQRFSKASFWPWIDLNEGLDTQRTRFHSYVNGSRMRTVAEYVEIILAYIQDLGKKPAYGGETLYILELEAQSGFLAFQLLSRLNIAGRKNNDIDIVYLISSEDPESLKKMSSEKKLSHFIKNGYLKFIKNHSYNDYQKREMTTFQDILPGFPDIKIPPVILAVNHLGSMEQDLFYVHYGKLYEAYLTMTQLSDDLNEEVDNSRLLFRNHSINVEWKLVDVSQIATELGPLSTILDRYIHKLDSSALLFPRGALLRITQLRKDFSQGFLLLAQDYGVSSNANIRMHTVEMLFEYEQQLLPLNGGILRCYCLLNDGDYFDFWGEAYSTSNAVMLAEGKFHDYPSTTCTLGKIKNDFNCYLWAKIKEGLAESGTNLSAEQTLAYFSLSHWDYGLLDIVMPAIAEQIAYFSPMERFNWIGSLEKMLEIYFPEERQPDYAFDIGFIATKLHAWQLAIKAYQESLHYCGDELICLTNLGFCYWQVGDTCKARSYLLRAISLDGPTLRAQSLLEEVTAWETYCLQRSWYFPEFSVDNEMILQPLGLHHTEEFFYQYRDSSIGELVRLPEFEQSDDVSKWIMSQQENDHSVFCITHKRYGFIGSIAMIRSAKSAFFYFWIGADYQGQGFAQRAGRLLLRQAIELWNVERVFTSTYQCNYRSRQALLNMGFISLPFLACEPDNDMCFWKYEYKDLDKKTEACSYHKDDYEELKSLLHACESSIDLHAVNDISVDGQAGRIFEL